MEQKTIEYQLSHDQWKLYFSRFADKNKYMIYVIVILVAFVVVYSLCLNQMNAGIGDELMYLLFAAFAAAFVYFFHQISARIHARPAGPRAMKSSFSSNSAPRRCTTPSPLKAGAWFTAPRRAAKSCSSPMRASGAFPRGGGWCASSPSRTASR